MSLKWVGVVAAMLGSVALGFALAITLGRRAKALDELVHALKLLESRVTHMQQPLSQAMQDLAQESTLFQAAARADRPPQAAWAASLELSKGLNAQDRLVATRMISDSASAGREEQAGIYRAGIAQLETRLAQAKGQAAGDAKLYRTLGVLAAVAILVLAI